MGLYPGKDSRITELLVVNIRRDMRSLSNGQRGPSTSAEGAWYCLQAKHKHEHIAAVHLRNLKGVLVFCPRIRFRRQTRIGIARVTEALFPGYLFAHFSLAKMQRAVA